MPLFKLKRVWDYCTYNKPFFIFIIILYGIVNFIEAYYETHLTSLLAVLIVSTCYIFVAGYGLTITRDRANHGVRLPKILPKRIFILGIKSILVVSIYFSIQTILLNLICLPLGFPVFDLEKLLFNLNETIHLFFINDPRNCILFIIFGSICFYITLFFLEIALARLADTGKLLSSFKVRSIKRTIDIIGWRHYVKDCTLIILTIVFLGFLKAYVIPVGVLDYIADVVLDLLIFATQSLGIGAAYAKFKDNQRKTISIS